MGTWPHAPSRQVSHPGAYIITASTLHKQKLFNTPDKLTLLENILLETLEELGWQPQAWAVFPNHYHFVGISPEAGLDLEHLSGKVHGNSARELNLLDNAEGRVVWYRSWDTRLSYEKSYLARLAYVHHNPVKHGVAPEARMYPWCSAEWFATKGHPAFVETVLSFKTDLVNVYDDF